MTNKMKFIAMGFMAGAVLVSCHKDNDPVPAAPTIENVEVGSGDNGIGVVGRDFHFNMDVVAGDRIGTIQVRIVQRAGETYAKEWEHEITWEQYNGAKNTNVHKHFDIPEDAPEGEYDFVIAVNDQSGAVLEEIRTVNIYLPENLPVDPRLSIFNIQKNGNFFYMDGEFTNDGDRFASGHILKAQATIEGVKGDGQMYILLINKKLGYLPETIEQVDFSKVVVYDTYEHEGWTEGDFFSNFVYDLEAFKTVRALPTLTIGAEQDNNAPQANPIAGANGWESGNYYFAVLYRNTTYNINFFHRIEIPIEIN